jgi:hypothetical protein
MNMMPIVWADIAPPLGLPPALAHSKLMHIA